MRLAVLVAIITVFAGSVRAEDDPLAAYLWTKRPIVVFASSDKDPRMIQQMAEFERYAEDLEERDVVILTDTDPAAAGPLRQRLRPVGFSVILIGKDGAIKLRRPAPQTAETISQHIDRMPMRLQEMGRSK